LCGARIGSQLILGSGYFQENLRGSPYSILQDNLLAAITGNSGLTRIEVYGAKLNGNGPWRVSFTNFVQRLRNSRIPTRAFLARRMNWHAKVALRIGRRGPVAAIIGSSNLTRPAYGIRPLRSWNYECDVTIWLPTKTCMNTFSKNSAAHNESIIMTAILDPQVEQPNEEEQLRRLLEQVKEESGGFEEV
jgi:hypothetical protein